MRDVFVSYHHANDQAYKEALNTLNKQRRIFNDYSVNTGEIITDDMTDQQIREKIRDDYLRNVSVTIVLAGQETWKRKHVDWEIYSSMFDGKINKQSGILVITLPTTNCNYYTAPYGGVEKTFVYPEVTQWVPLDRKSNEERYPFLPPRLIDNLSAPNVNIAVVDWNRIYRDPDKLAFLIELTAEHRSKNVYDLSRAMQRRNL